MELQRHTSLDQMGEERKWKQTQNAQIKVTMTWKMKVWKSCSLSVLLDFLRPMDYSPPGFSVHVILQARKWVAIPFSRGSSYPEIKPRSPALQADSLPSEPWGKPINDLTSLKTWFCGILESNRELFFTYSLFRHEKKHRS